MGLWCCPRARSSPVRRPSLAVGCGRLTAVVWLQSTGSRPGLQCWPRGDSVVAAHRCNCSAACEVFPDQGSNPCPLPGGFLTAGPPSEPKERFIKRYRPPKKLEMAEKNRLQGSRESVLFTVSPKEPALQTQGSLNQKAAPHLQTGQDRAVKYSRRFHALSSPLIPS